MSLGSLLWWCLMLHYCLLVSLMCVALPVKLIRLRKGLHLLMYASVWLFRVVCSLLAQSWWRVWKRRWISMDISTHSMALTWVFFPPDSLHGSTFEPWLSVQMSCWFCASLFFSGGFSGQFSLHSTQQFELWLICASSTYCTKQPWKCWNI